MAQKTVGILSMADMLKVRFQSPVQLGLDTIERSLRADLATHNRLMKDALAPFVEYTDQRRRRYGVSGTLQFDLADEFTRAHTQKVLTGSEVEFPMDGFQASIGWTAMFFKNKSVADLATTQTAAKIGHALKVRREFQRSIFLSTNYTVLDYRVDNVSLDVKRLVNADSAPIPIGPNAETFDAATHTHYLFHNGLDNTSAHSLVNTVLEHYNSGAPKVYINVADEAGWTGLTDFKAYIDSRLTVNQNTNQTKVGLDAQKTNDRAIGLFGAAEVWVKPWGIANYALCSDLMADKPVVARTRDGGGITLDTVGTNVLFPLQADYMESEFGFGVWNRTNGAILYHAGGAGAYVDPTL